MLLKKRRSHFLYTFICLSITVNLWISLTNNYQLKNGQQHHSEAIVTLLTGDSYLCGVLVLGYTLKKYGATNDRDILVLIPHGTLNNTQHVNMVEQVGWTIINVKRIPFPSKVVQRLEDGLVKLYAWNMTQYAIIATLDADTVLTGSIEEAFQSMRMNPNIQMLAVNDLFMTKFKLYEQWKNKYFNAGVLFFRPSTRHFENLVRHSSNQSYYDLRTPQQNLLNKYYLDQWHELPMTYNLLDYLPRNHSLFKDHWNKNTRILHFAGREKPWHARRRRRAHVNVTIDTHGVWRQFFSEMVNEYGWTKEHFLRRHTSNNSVLEFDFETVVNKPA